MKRFLVLLISVMAFSCKNETNPKALTANVIVDKAIEVAGGDVFDNSKIAFVFRDKSYRAHRSNGKFELSRSFITEGNSFSDFISNNGFKRIVNDLPVKIPDSIAVKYTASINSVHYFSVLPYGLNDKAVNKTLLGEEQIKGKTYYKIKVTFNEEGGGEDFEDVFIYWINKESFKVDYLAYSYNEDDDVGMRFRQAYNERFINKLRFVDYNNFKTKDNSVSLLNLGKAFEKNQLKLLSKIELENIDVILIDN